MRAVVRLSLKGLLLGLFWLAYWARFTIMLPLRIASSEPG